mmetsp:Transcript_47720/g.137433  ORF Transcript_47720/g.137433 Transcript_47720/m.137433 type:complete len:261 (+) Transcript_47720:189-971(+)
MQQQACCPIFLDCADEGPRNLLVVTGGGTSAISRPILSKKASQTEAPAALRRERQTERPSFASSCGYALASIARTNGRSAERMSGERPPGASTSQARRLSSSSGVPPEDRWAPKTVNGRPVGTCSNRTDSTPLPFCTSGRKCGRMSVAFQRSALQKIATPSSSNCPTELILPSSTRAWNKRSVPPGKPAEKAVRSASFPSDFSWATPSTSSLLAASINGWSKPALMRPILNAWEPKLGMNAWPSSSKRARKASRPPWSRL